MPCRQLRYNSENDWPRIAAWLKGRFVPDDQAEERVKAILTDVAARGDEALAEYTQRFDCPNFTTSQLRVPETEIKGAAQAIPAEDLNILRQAADNIRTFHQAQLRQSWWTTRPDGTVLGQMVTPVDRAGLYVPGGQGGETPLVSSLLMNAIPALVAGVGEVALVSPPRKDGTLNEYILAAADLLGITEVYRLGSAWAVAALALGTDTVRPVDVIAGPGNIYVTTAKRLLAGQVGIDMIAGPSEIVVLADATADPAWLAADMLSQAEHDPLASALLVTLDQTLAQGVLKALKEQRDKLPRSEIAKESLANWGAVVVVPDMERGVELVNHLAPEHLELAMEDPWTVVPRIRNAGAVFMGSHTPEAVGDYFAGPNHVLPTLGTARFSSALSVDTFRKETSIIAASPAFVSAHGSKIARLARLEGLEAHARSMERRLGEQRLDK